MATQFYYSENDKQLGPFSLEELKEKNIAKDTLVWYEGLEQWTKASDIVELQVLLKPVPPPLPLKSEPPPLTIKSEPPILPTKTVSEPIIEKKAIEPQKVAPQKKKKRKALLIVGLIVGGLLLSYIGLVIYVKLSIYSDNHRANNNETPIFNTDANTNSNTYTEPPKEKTPEELRQELYAKEKRKSKDYLTISYSLDRTMFSGKDVINGYITNSATMATFKDVVVKVTCLTGTGTELRQDDYVVYQYVYPGKSTSFQIKTVSPSGTKKIGVTVVSATGE